MWHPVKLFRPPPTSASSTSPYTTNTNTNNNMSLSALAHRCIVGSWVQNAFKAGPKVGVFIADLAQLAVTVTSCNSSQRSNSFLFRFWCLVSQVALCSSHGITPWPDGSFELWPARYYSVLKGKEYKTSVSRPTSPLPILSMTARPFLSRRHPS